LAVRLEPIILELEREKSDLLIIAHESVLRVLYGYLMACDAMDIPKLKFPRNEIIEVSDTTLNPNRPKLMIQQIIPASYQNEAKRIYIPGLPQSIIPGSPEDIRIPVPPSGVVSPLSGIGTPAEPANPDLPTDDIL
jgi:6-phosphofructo-2-kinase / fructose-2,6-biphosphatase 4